MTTRWWRVSAISRRRRSLVKEELTRARQHVGIDRVPYSPLTSSLSTTTTTRSPISRMLHLGGRMAGRESSASRISRRPRASSRRPSAADRVIELEGQNSIGPRSGLFRLQSSSSRNCASLQRRVNWQTLDLGSRGAKAVGFDPLTYGRSHHLPLIHTHHRLTPLVLAHLDCGGAGENGRFVQV